MRARLVSSPFGDFRCDHCHVIVSSAHMLSGVNNRNHCPYCLWSCHLDLFAAGDRLCACKAPMKPIGLTMKKGKNKYQCEPRGELMLIHECVECKTLSINRIAADDDSATVLAVFEKSFTLSHQIHTLCQENGIVILNVENTETVHTQIYGHYGKVPALSWT
ncbi:MAG TPA: RNHCP domain-containing protein [Anaerolineales bacterium]